MNGTSYSSKLVLPKNLYSLMASQAFTDELGKKARLDALDRARICLGLEEAILDVVAHSYGVPEKSMYEIVFSITDCLFSIIIRDAGRPIDSEIASQTDQEIENSMDNYLESGLGFQIMRNSFDQVMVKNHPDGKELHLIKYLPVMQIEQGRPEIGTR